MDDLPVSYQYPTYADTVAASSLSTENSTQISSPTTSAYNDWRKEKQELEDQIQKQAMQIQRQDEQIEKIQVVLEAKITRSHELEEQLAQALDLAHSRDTRHEEMMEKFEMLMQLQTGKVPNKEQQLPGTPARQQIASESPPSKKANTNTSPARHVYAMFKQQPGRQMTNMGKHFTARQASPMTAVHDMDTDDDPPHTKPAVRPGKKIE